MRNETKRYVAYYLRQCLKPFLFILTVALVVTLVTCSVGRADVYQYPADEQWTTYYERVVINLKLEIPAIIAAVVSYMQVYYQLSVFKKRRNLDCYYSLPLSRKTLGVIHYLTGLGITLTTFTASIAVNLLTLIPTVVKYSPKIDYAYILLYFIISIITISAQYSVLAFAFDRGNTAGDGRWMMALYTFLPALTSGAVMAVLGEISSKRYYGNGDGILPYYGANTANSFEKLALEKGLSDSYTFNLVLWTILWTVLGAAAAIGFLLLFAKQPTNKTEEISDSIFAYKTLIPAFVFLGLLNFNDVLELIPLIIISVLAVIGYVIYRRGFRLKRQDIISLGASLLAAFIVGAWMGA